MDIKPIETRYKGYHFRSRLEARWAIFFDALGVEWEYEKDGYALDEAGLYLPDFWIPLISRAQRTRNPDNFYDGQGFFVEIKANEPNDEERLKLYMLAKLTKHTVMCFWGTPWADDWYATIYKGSQGGKLFSKISRFDQFKKELIDIETQDRHQLPFGLQFNHLNVDNIDLALTLAFRKARSARFEHGENGT